MSQNPENTAPKFKVFINGSELQPEMMVDLLTVRISDYVEGADIFSIKINMWNPQLQRLKWLDEEVFDEGNEIEIKMGYIDNLESLIIGEVTAIEPHYSDSEPSSVNVQGYDRIHRFRRGKKSRTYNQIKDSQIAERIAQDLQLLSQVDDSQIVHDYIFQNNQSDIDFLLERARRIRYEVSLENRTLFFKKAANDQGKTLTLEFGTTLRSFYPRLTTMQQVSEVVVKGWNPTTKEPIIGRAQKGDEITQMDGDKTGAAITADSFGDVKTFIVDKPIYSQTEAEQMAKAKFNDISINFLTGEGTAIGNTRIKAGEVIELKKLGRRFNGLYYVTSSTHTIDDQGYTTKFRVGRNST